MIYLNISILIIVIAILYVVVRIYFNIKNSKNGETMSATVERVKQEKHVSKLPDKVISPSKVAEANSIQSELDDEYGVDK